MRVPSLAVVIEDDTDVAGLISLTLRRSGFTTRIAATGPDGVEAVRAHNPVLITVDFNLPGFDGIEAVRQIRTFSNARILMVSASESIDNRYEASLAGADDYLIKPFSPRYLQSLATLGIEDTPAVRRSGINDGD